MWAKLIGGAPVITFCYLLTPCWHTQDFPPSLQEEGKKQQQAMM
jgi:hypothetical protein